MQQQQTTVSVVGTALPKELDFLQETACHALLCVDKAPSGASAAFQNLAFSQVSAGVAQLVEHRFCKPEVRGSSPLASSGRAAKSVQSHTQFGDCGVKDCSSQGCNGSVGQANSFRSIKMKADTSVSRPSQVGCPSGQREQAVNLPAYAYVGSNPTPTTLIVNHFGNSSANDHSALTRNRKSIGGVAQLVELQLSKLIVASSNLVSPSVNTWTKNQGVHTSALIAQLVERVLGKDEVTSSNLVEGSHENVLVS